MRRAIIFPLALTLSLLASPAMAQEPLTARKAVDLAIAENPRMRAAERQIEAARARETQAAALPNPNLSLQAEEVPVSNPGGGTFLLGISQPLLLGGQREVRGGVARLERELAEIDRVILRRDLAAEVRDAYARLLFMQEGVRLARSNREAAESLLQATRARHKAGELAKVEVLREEVERSRAEREVAAAEGRELQARGRLNVLLGRSAQSPLTIQPLQVAQLASLPPVAQLVSRSLESRVELQRAGLAIERERLQRRLAQAGLWTGTEVGVSGGMIEGQPGISGGITIPIPFYRQQGEVAEAEANRLRAEAERDALRNTITLEVEEAYREARSAAQQAELFRSSYVPQAEQLADNARRRFLAGEGSGLDVIDAQRALRETQVSYQQALLEYRQAIARLERAVGADLP